MSDYTRYHEILVVMKKNLGSLDRLTRLTVVALITSLYFTNLTSDLNATISLAIALVLIITSLSGWCFFYAILGIKTCPVKRYSLKEIDNTDR